MHDPKPTMYMLAGPNGAGKTTLYETVIKPNIDAPFINADYIQKNELPDQSMEGAYKAAKLAEQRRQEHLRDKTSFVSESTFSHPSKLQLIQQAKDAGFRVNLYHVNVRSANLSVARVTSRVQEGGHDVPEEKIRARYERNQRLIRQAALLSDKAIVYDNSALNQKPQWAIIFENGRVNRISGNIPAWARNLYENELKPYSKARQNALAASYADLREIAKHIGGRGNDEKVMIPSPNQKSYSGPVVGESALHYLQQAKEINQFVAHIKTALNQSVEVGEDVSIKYLSRYKAEVNKIDIEKQLQQNVGLSQNSKEKRIEQGYLVTLSGPSLHRELKSFVKVDPGTNRDEVKKMIAAKVNSLASGYNLKEIEVKVQQHQQIEQDKTLDKSMGINI